MTVLEQLIELSCRFFVLVRFVRQQSADKTALLGFIGQLDDGQHLAVTFDGSSETVVAEKLQVLVGNLIACFDGVGAVLETQPEAAREQALIVARLLERGSITFRMVHGVMAVQSLDMAGIPAPVIMVRRPDQSTLELLHTFETWLQVRWPKDLTS